MNKIPMNVPVFIRSSEEEQTSVLYSKAKLKIFYVGETADHRIFTKEFSDKLLETLPNTPVVGFYSEEDEDFKGHNSIQYIYGIVPESAAVTFEEEDGTTFAITDVILYTGRKDNIGTVASKICGKQHSLELDPDTLKYKINRDNNGRFMNLEFISGNFVGLSVLGDNETPAFAGSEFFTTNEDFVKIIEQSEAKFSKFINLLNNNGGKLEVFNSEAFFGKCADMFAKITMQEFAQKIYAALDEMQVYGYIVENTDEYAIISQWNVDESRAMYVKYAITVDEGNLSLGNPVEVYAKYLTQEEVNTVENPINTATALEEEEKDEDESKCKSESVPPVSDEEDDEKEVEDDEDKSKASKIEDDEEKEEDKTSEPKSDEDEEDPKQKEDYSVNNANSETNAEGDIANAKESEEQKTNTGTEDEEDKDEDKVGNATANTSATTLSDSERTELEQYRRAEKLGMIAEYKGDIADELIDSFNANVDNYSKDQLAASLALEFRKVAKAARTVDNNSSVQVRAFGLLSNNSVGKYDENNPADVINKYKNK